MAKKDQISVDDETVFLKETKKTVKITNRYNSPYDLTLITLGVCERIEPRGKNGDTITVPLEWIKHKDFESAKEYLIITE